MKYKKFWIENEIEKPLVTASHFGFMPIETPRIRKEDAETVSDCVSQDYFDAREKSSFIRAFLENDLVSSPNPFSVCYRRESSKHGEGGYSLYSVGSFSGFADASIIRTTLSMLGDLGYKDTLVRINSIGDKDSMSSHEKELQTLIRRYSNEFPETLREMAKRDIFEIFRTNSPEMSDWKEKMPPSISFLSSQSRNHFKEVLEFIEALGINFEIEPSLVGERNHSSHTIFTIRNEKKPDEVLASGYHFSRLSKRLGLKRELPMVGASIFIPKKNEDYRFRIYKNLPSSKFYLIQLGREAKLRVLPLLENLRKENIRVYHLLSRDKVSVQIESAEKFPVTHHIILGQKEALENTATIRNVSTRAQITIPLSELPRCLKCLPI